MRHNVVLIGFMGTGKTTVGRLLASRLGCPFVDTDGLIEERAGRSIPEIFTGDGEEAFRRLESDVVAEVGARRGVVVATGGGVVLRSENVAHLRRHGLLVALIADPGEIVARVASGRGRPLLGADPEAAVRRITEARRSLYLQADLVVDTSGASADEVAQRVEAFAAAWRGREGADPDPGAPAAARAGAADRAAAPVQPRESAGTRAGGSLSGSAGSAGGPPVGPTGLRGTRAGEGVAPPPAPAERTVRVAAGPRAYEVVIGRALLPSAGTRLRDCGVRGRVALLTHPRLAALYGGPVIQSLRAAGCEPELVTVPPSESSKSLRVAARVYDALLEARLDRASALVVLGGGVAGDLGGFVAATFLRGIAWAAVPTTLLAQVDAAIGGKTGVNHRRGKNLIGAVHQPVLVLADVETLRSLPRREVRSGMAEVIKTGVIGAPDLFAYLEGSLKAVLARRPDALVEVVARCAEYKARIVAGDEREEAGRVVLNYGHTIGHGIEAAAGYRGLTHGEAIAVGMTLEAAIAVRLGICDPAVRDRQTALLRAAGLPVRRGDLRPRPAPHAIAAAMAHDKKARAGRLRFVLPAALGRTVVTDDVPAAVIEEVLAGD